MQITSCVSPVQYSVGRSFILRSLYYSGAYLPLLVLVSIGLYVKGMLDFVKGCFFSASVDNIVTQVLGSMCIVYYFDQFGYVEPSVHPWTEVNLTLVYDICNMMLSWVYRSQASWVQERALLFPSGSQVLELCRSLSKNSPQWFKWVVCVLVSLLIYLRVSTILAVSVVRRTDRKTVYLFSHHYSIEKQQKAIIVVCICKPGSRK